MGEGREGGGREQGDIELVDGRVERIKGEGGVGEEEGRGKEEGGCWKEKLLGSEGKEGW